ncbi:hypothetical protein KZX18_00585 [Micrococcus luteus]|uniref:hypothetical protein n=1 Tax=Micrococcus luteus TaxID=1270 RepID=UPI002005AB88|nr:hypothetical protein [Micrococcus luteus]MCK6108479.1 hypothetical protein [Micrococcus luteus]
MVVAIILATGVSIVATWISHLLGMRIAGWLGLGMIVAALLYVVATTFRELEENDAIDGFVPFFDGRTVRVPEYGLSMDLERALTAILTENKALRKKWRESPLMTGDQSDLDTSDPGVRLLVEAMEYVLLEKLSATLANYFNVEGSQLATQEFERKELLPLLEHNRILDQLSRPEEDRIGLVEASQAGGNKRYMRIYRVENGNTDNQVLEYATDGTYVYSRVAFTLPKGAKVERVAPGVIRISSRHIQIELHSIFEGFTASLESVFVNHYLDLPHDAFSSSSKKPGSAYLVRFGISTKISIMGLLSRKAGKLYAWSESFVERCKEDYGHEEFLKSIHWVQARTLIRIQTVAKNARTRRAASSAEDADSHEGSNELEQEGTGDVTLGKMVE